MSHTFIKKTAILTLLMFTLMIISENYSFAQDVDKFQELKKAEEFYNDGDYDSARENLDAFINKYKERREELKDEFCFAYLIKAKIEFDLGNDKERTTALRNLFDIYIDYNLSNEEPDFVKQAEETRQKVRAEKERLTKPKEESPVEPTAIEVKPPTEEKDEIQPGEKTPVVKEPKVEKTPADTKEDKAPGEPKNVIVKDAQKKKPKKFPVLLAVVGVAAIGAVIYFLTKKKSPKEFTLAVVKGEGINGEPESGANNYKKNTVVNYAYRVKRGYKDLVVKIDDQEVATSGSITMDRDHTLSASATQIPDQYFLTVNKGTGINGTPESGTYPYYLGTPVNYSYTLQDGYTNLEVKVDGSPVQGSGNITMEKDHTLTATASKSDDTPPTVQITSPANGATVSGTITISATVTDDKGITKVEFYIDNELSYSINQSLPIHSLSASSYNFQWDTTKYTDGTHVIKVIAYDTSNQAGEKTITVTVDNDITQKYKLEVTIQFDGATGTPSAGPHEYDEGTEVEYHYEEKTGYIITSIELDGEGIPKPAGTFTMDKDHQLNVYTKPNTATKEN